MTEVSMFRAVLLVLAATCSGALPQASAQSDVGPSPAAIAKADSGRPPYAKADVKFMQGMIAHHAQAIVMAAMAPAHGARANVRILAERIDVAQRDEIAFMQRWLRDRRETVPDPNATHDMRGHKMSDMDMPEMRMPGMLTADQMALLSAASGAAFDRLFLTFMIQHHRGALTMVEELFASPGAGQDGAVFRFASDVTADQTTEINRMTSMLRPN
jgi:uncharacterized protein (DUF305 family)